MKLTEYLSGHHDYTIDILNELDFTDISRNKQKQQVRFAREDGRNPSSVVLDLSTLAFKCFSDNSKGNLYTLIMKKKGLSFPASLNYVADKLGLEKSELNVKINLPFGGFYKQLIKDIEEPECSMRTYDESVIEPYLNKYNMMFFNDGIDFDVQREFKIGFDLETCRITVPTWTLDGKLCGIMGRSINSQCEHEFRWLPIIPCSRSLTLYGYHKNYETIQEKGLCVIAESEKGVMQMRSFGSKVGLATCGNNISDIQAKYIKGLMIPKIILAYDEGLSEEDIRVQAKKLMVNNSIYKNSVGYVYDSENEILPKGSKSSPSDMGKEKFTYLIKNKVRWVNNPHL